MEVLVKLLEGKNRLLDQQTLLITENEGVFQFMPIQTQAENLTIEVSVCYYIFEYAMTKKIFLLISLERHRAKSSLIFFVMEIVVQVHF